MVRTQIQLTDEQARSLKRLAHEQGVSIAEIVRQSLALLLRSPIGQIQGERFKRAKTIAGRFHSGCSDVSAKHDKHLVEAYRK